MISRFEYYAGIILLAVMLIYSNISTDISIDEIQKARINARDSILQVQRDSALNRSLQFELKADSLQSVINRKKLDLQIIKKKYENEKKNVLVLNADSTLSLFMRSNTPH